MPKLAQALLTDFGMAVKHARSLRGWELNDLANRIAQMEAGKPGQKVKAPARTFLSDIEKGKRSISPPTVGKLISALTLPDTWLDRFLATAPDDTDEVTRGDQDADHLLQMAATDQSLPPTAEGLLIGLAQSYTAGNFHDHVTAYVALKSALEVAQAMKSQGSLPSNTDSQLESVLREVARLNDLGELETAANLLDDEFTRASSSLETVVQRQLDQDRLLNRPETAAKRIVARLSVSVLPGDLFRKIERLVDSTREEGEHQGNPFDLFLALELAKLNIKIAQGHQGFLAQNDLGNCYMALGQIYWGEDHLAQARKAFVEAIRLTPRKLEPLAWAAFQDNLGIVHSLLGERNHDADSLREAIKSHKAALTVRNEVTTPEDWAWTQNNLGTALWSLGEITSDPAHILGAIAAFRAALSIRTREAAPIDWAVTQTNLGIALSSLGERANNSAQLDEAISAFRDALTVYARDATPVPWAHVKNNLGSALSSLGGLSRNTAFLREAILVFRSALEVYTPGANPIDHARAEHNLGVALHRLGTLERNPDEFAAARDAYLACLKIRPREVAPVLCATTQWNLADLFLAWHTLDPQPARLVIAQGHLDAARTDFAEAGNTLQIAECDRLQRLIDNARTASGEAPPPPRGEG